MLAKFIRIEVARIYTKDRYQYVYFPSHIPWHPKIDRSETHATDYAVAAAETQRIDCTSYGALSHIIIGI